MSHDTSSGEEGRLEGWLGRELAKSDFSRRHRVLGRIVHAFVIPAAKPVLIILAVGALVGVGSCAAKPAGAETLPVAERRQGQDPDAILARIAEIDTQMGGMKDAYDAAMADASDADSWAMQWVQYGQIANGAAMRLKAQIDGGTLAGDDLAAARDRLARYEDNARKVNAKADELAGKAESLGKVEPIPTWNALSQERANLVELLKQVDGTKKPGSGVSSSFGDVRFAVHRFVSGTEGRPLPVAVLEQMPMNRSHLLDGQTVAPPVDFAPVADDGGTWRFVSWDQNSATLSGGNVTFTGTWVWERDPEPAKYKATFEFVADDGSKLPEGVTDQLPKPIHGLVDGNEVGVGDGFKPVKVDGGTWRLVSWDYERQTVRGADLVFVATWHFDKDEPENPQNPGEPQQPENPQQPGEPQQPENPQQPAKVLPQMGDSSALLLPALGASSLAALAGGLLLRRREV